LQKIFFAPTPSTNRQARHLSVGFYSGKMIESPSQAHGSAGPNGSVREWDQITDERFAVLKGIRQPILVVNGVHDEMIPSAILIGSARIYQRCPFDLSRLRTRFSFFSFTSPSLVKPLRFLASDSSLAPY